MTNTISRTKFVPHFVERDMYRNSRIDKLLYTATNSWVNAWGNDVIGATWLFGLTTSGEYLAEKIENGGATREKRAWSLTGLRNMVTWYRDHNWDIQSTDA